MSQNKTYHVLKYVIQVTGPTGILIRMMSILKSVHFFNAFNVFKKAPIQKILKENLACDQTPKKPRQFIENVLCKKSYTTYK